MIWIWIVICKAVSRFPVQSCWESSQSKGEKLQKSLTSETTSGSGFAILGRLFPNWGSSDSASQKIPEISSFPFFSLLQSKAGFVLETIRKTSLPVILERRIEGSRFSQRIAPRLLPWIFFLATLESPCGWGLPGLTCPLWLLEWLKKNLSPALRFSNCLLMMQAKSGPT